MTDMFCEVIRKALADFSGCVLTDAGARVATHCLYPSFEPVHVFIAKVGDGFDVHDGGSAFRAAWLHGRDEPVINKAIRDACGKFQLGLSERAIHAKVTSADWIASAILGVANASALAAHEAVAKIIAVAEEALVAKMDRTLAAALGPKAFERNVEVKGMSGGARHFDFMVGTPSDPKMLINGVASHRNSISAKYVAFADTELEKSKKFAVHESELGHDDTLLLLQVASVVPLASLGPGARRSLHG